MSEFGDEDMDYSDQDQDDYEDYYNAERDVKSPPYCPDPEYFPVQCLTVDEVEKFLNELVEQLCNSIHVTPSMSKVLLYENKWAVQEVLWKFEEDADKLFIASRMKTLQPVSKKKKIEEFICAVCVAPVAKDLGITSLACGHCYCDNCWRCHFESKISQGVSTELSCMALNCDLLVPEEIVLSAVNKPVLRKQYQHFAFCEYIKSHPLLRFCPGANCNVVIKSVECLAKKATCTQCETSFCFKCGNDYHAPTDCVTIKKWITKCADDSETANYITGNTKECPKCNICIEKNGGCNHMQCLSCKFDFCWMCLGDWKAHGTEYYDCSKYRENPQNGSESAKAREALKRYLHYYERWENHSKSLLLEKQTSAKIKERINSKVMTSKGTWIDWQYLLDAATLLAKCRYTLQYTYPYAYYLDNGPKKELFEYQQAKLEAEIENLSWKIERAETTDRAELENQMDVAEKRRGTMLQDFFQT
ncbi:Zinc finger, RING/FYVE/PHD-type,IBR domain [Cinara cedri]|uniref:RBR-type E3 ubiquitin transferase n=1 Tax=Cinara cedri TaxID=506608 RepID=A0A5E4N405_9HEMI|nr:Zinc finger, RING/FYVE/PHD-type,IBR domain [Cinara cedri]